MNEDTYHESVMVREVTSTLNVKSGDKIIDATLGTGGHTLALLESGAVVLGIEKDQSMIELARKRLSKKFQSPKFTLVQGNFSEIDQISRKEGFEKVDGILLDLGVSNLQLTGSSRGFSFSNPEAPLDMRIDPENQGVKACDLLNVLRQDQLEELFSEVMDPRHSRWLTKRVIEKRGLKLFEKVSDFLEVISGIKSKPGLNPATLPFLALRIAVNFELDNLKAVLPKAFELLGSGGKMMVITFHSGEDEIVKNFGKNDVIFPSQEEISKNQKSRSAKLRVFTK